MRALPHPSSAEGTAAIVAVIVALAAMAALGLSPADDRPVVGAALIGAVVAALGILVALGYTRRSHSRRAPRQLAQDTTEAWFSAPTLEGFPARELAPLLSGEHPPSPNRLQTAWVFATHGQDAVWLEHHFGLPGDVAHVLVDAAHHHGESH
ncbi:hypothetical protein P3T36_003912 [Kitasatospora sp. MAP12-15]|uniref:hypothetical protein n=1 Tax=unclassified Kitasatospora TaxID=2633591 RepID=UPI0024748506|nr:hypothetical protein [Kitasatospora sp. MAP12-44]MDH6108444.1 hypothetical protein [Kitasatospora sp. MAP12-44]